MDQCILDASFALCVCVSVSLFVCVCVCQCSGINLYSFVVCTSREVRESDKWMMRVQ